MKIHPWNGNRSRPNVKEQIIKKKGKGKMISTAQQLEPTMVLANKGIYGNGRATGGYRK